MEEACFKHIHLSVSGLLIILSSLSKGYWIRLASDIEFRVFLNDINYQKLNETIRQIKEVFNKQKIEICVGQESDYIAMPALVEPLKGNREIESDGGDKEACDAIINDDIKILFNGFFLGNRAKLHEAQKTIFKFTDKIESDNPLEGEDSASLN